MFDRKIRKLKYLRDLRRNKALVQGKTKYFCIGRNKTGTTSIKKAFQDLGYVVGEQSVAESLANRYYFNGNFDPIINYCRSAQVFQDVPFSWDNTYKHLDDAFPYSKFILTVRTTSEQWYQSISKFHAKKFGNGRVPTKEDLRSANYVAKGYMYKAVKLHGGPDNDLYNKEVLIKHYEQYNKGVKEYFSGRANDLLVINLEDEGSYQSFIDFIGANSPLGFFPWENRT